MEVKIGVTDSPREIVFNSDQAPEKLEKDIAAALTGDNTVLTLSDDKGRRFLVQSARVAYVELGPADGRRVGFGISGGSD